MAAETREGGCLCGAVRYRVRGAPRWVAHCHCRSCRLHTGSPMTTFAGFAQPHFEWLRGEPRAHASSPGVRRTHCAGCGTPLTYEAERVAHEVHVYLTTLDEPAAFAPQMHVFVEEALPWPSLDDGLPRHARLPPRQPDGG